MSDDKKKFEDLDPEKIIEEMREEYWRGLSEADETVDGDSAQLLFAVIRGERFAFDAPLCRTITKAGHLTRVPRMPSFMLGVVNLRGEILSVVDLGSLLGLPAQDNWDPKSRLILVDSQGVRICFQVDRIIGIEWVPMAGVQEPQSSSATLKTEYIKGHIAPAGDEGWTTYLNVEKLVGGQELTFNH